MNLLETAIRFHRAHRYSAHVLFWVVILLVAVSSSKYHDGTEGTYGFEFVSDFLFMIPEIIAAYLVTYWLLFQFLYRKRYVTTILGFFAVSYLCSALGRILVVKVCEPLAGLPSKAFETYANMFSNVPKLIYNYFFQIFAIVFVFVALKTVKDQVSIRQRTLILEKEKAETELKLLKAQLNPHFLFNTLNNIYSLSLTDPQRTPASIARLADILDYVLYRSHERFVPLSGEIKLIKDYIELEKLRYDDRLSVQFETAIRGEAVIAPLLLLSLVENAFKHGASTDADAPLIKINLSANAKHIHFEITNTVAGTPEMASRPKQTIGLSNLRRQLDHLYGREHDMQAGRRGNLFYVSLTVDLKAQCGVYEESAMFAGG